MKHVLPEGLARPVPSADGLDGPYWQGTREERLCVPRCASCGTFRWAPEWLCYACHSFDTEWIDVDARGVLFSFQRVWHPASPAVSDAVPYLNVLVELPHAGGIRMVGNYADDPQHQLEIGTPMVAVFEHHEGENPYTLVQWRREDAQ